VKAAIVSAGILSMMLAACSTMPVSETSFSIEHKQSIRAEDQAFWYVALSQTLEDIYRPPTANWAMTSWGSRLRAVGRTILVDTERVSITELLYYLEITLTEKNITYRVSGIRQVFGGYSKDPEAFLDLTTRASRKQLEDLFQIIMSEIQAEAENRIDSVTADDVFLSERTPANLEFTAIEIEIPQISRDDIEGMKIDESGSETEQDDAE
jgi:hypothetical protein